MRLAEFQALVRGAILGSAAPPLRALLVGGHDPFARFAIHQRHYEASLVRALVEKFPALVWVAGSPLVTEAAHAFVRQDPPRSPCIAEYGSDFPTFLAGRAKADRGPWLRALGELEWQLGRAARAVEHRPIGAEALRTIDPGLLADCTLVLQPGLSYLAAGWPVDELVQLFLSDHALQSYVLNVEDVLLEIRGARGAFTLARLDPGTFAFRSALVRNFTIGGAAEQALDDDPAFDPGRGLLELIAAALVTAIGRADGNTQP